MKLIKKIGINLVLALLLATFAVSFAISAASHEAEPERKSVTHLARDESTQVVLAAPKDSGIEHNAYRIIFSSDNFSGDMTFAKELSTALLEYDAPRLNYYSDSVADETKYEILFGNTNRTLSAELAEKCKNYTEFDALVWGFEFRDGKLAFAANSNEAFTRGAKEFTELYVKDGVLSVPSNLMKISYL